MQLQQIFYIKYFVSLIMDSNKAERQKVADYVNGVLQSYAPAKELLPLTEDNCVEALHDGVLLSYIVNCLSTTGPIINQGSLKKTKATIFHKMDQVNKVLEATKQIGLNIVNVRGQFVVQKKQDAIINLFNQITRQKPRLNMEKKPSQKPQTKNERSPPVSEPQRKAEQPQKPQQNKFVIQENTQAQPTSISSHQQQHHTENSQQKQQKTGKPIPHSEPHSQPSQPHHQQPHSHPNPQSNPHPPHPQPQPQPQDPKQQILHMPINQHQYFPKQSETGYHFEQLFGPQIVVLCGSLRQGSVNRGIVHAIENIKSKPFFENIHFHTPDLSYLPLLNVDLIKTGKIPKAVQDLRSIVKKSLGILIATPQYNGTFSGIVKNAFDWLSQTYDPSPLVQKKIGIVSASYLTQNQIKDTIQMGQFHKCNYFPESFYINLRSGAIDMQTGQLTNAHELDKLALWYQQFSYFILSGNPKPTPSPRFIMV